jgi:lipopolysaccharide export system permease protein
MKILDRYIIRELVGPFLFGFALFVTVLVSGEYLFKLTAFIARGAPFLDVVELFGLRIVIVSVITLPMAMLLATLLALGRLSSESELVAIQAGGVPILRISYGAIAFGLAVSIAGFVINERLVPPAGRRSAMIEEMIVTSLRNELIGGIGGGKAYVIQDFDGRQLARIVVAREFDAREGTMKQVQYIQYSEGVPKFLVQAERAQWINSNQWRFTNAQMYALGPVAGDKRVRVEGVPEATVLILNKTPGQIAKGLKKPEEMSYRELEAYIKEQRELGIGPRNLRELEVGLHNKISMPFASLVFALLGTPLGIRRHRSGAAVGVGISILVIFAYYVLWHSMAVLGENGQVSTLLASWCANIVGGITGLFLLFRAGR